MEDLKNVLDEIRWRYPTARVSCGAIVGGPQLRILSSSHPAGTSALTNMPMFGSAVCQWLALLETAGRELVVPNIAEDPRFDDLGEAILGSDTVSTAVFVLRRDDALLGFLRVDVAHPEELVPGLVDAARGAVPAATLAAQLERARAHGWAVQRKVDELEATLEAQRIRDRERVGALNSAIDDLRDRLQRVAAGLEPGPRQAVESSLSYGVERVEKVLRSLAEPLAEAAH